MLNICIGSDNITVAPNDAWKSFNDKTLQWLASHAHCGRCGKNFNPETIACTCGAKSEFVIPQEKCNELDKLAKKEYRRRYDIEKRIRRNENINNADGFYTKSNIDQIYKMQSGNCAYCNTPLINSTGQKKFTIDHIKSLSSGGSEWPDNLVVCCNDCNRKKGPRYVGYLWKYIEKTKGKKFVENQKIQFKNWRKQRRLITKNNKQKT